jgi:acetylornithine/succinyldiaminopimelate/putrescine aminotransferase
MTPRPPLLDTFQQILDGKLPNFFRLYLNPHVAGACLCLTRYVQTTRGTPTGPQEEDQTFLANAFDEALSGAIKLARYSACLAGRPSTGLILDPAGRLGPYASASLGDGRAVQFLPGLVVAGTESDLGAAVASGPFGLVVLVPSAGDLLDRHAGMIRAVIDRGVPLVITCVDRPTLAALRRGRPDLLLRQYSPDITVFDESFVNREVPFAALTARKALYDHWNRPGKTTFHSTTFQPNAVSCLHFLRCQAEADPEFHASLARELEQIRTDPRVRADLFRRLYSPSLYRAIRATGFDTADVRAAGDFAFADGRPVFDAVSGVACSVRGHNPPTYVEELTAQGSLADCEAEVASRLRRLTGLDHVLPAVSGATAVESALKLALVAQFPRRHVLALKAGFGGKTLLALTGTANPSYKEHIDPLYPDVLYVDPFAPDAESRLEAMLERYPVAVVQIELVQGVGGVQAIPERVVRCLEARRRDRGYLLLVDEVQTGMYRTGQVTLSRAMGLTPDLLLMGKGASDMMFPFALVLYSAGVQESLDRTGSDLPAAIRQSYGYEFGFRTVLNVLRRAEELSLPRRVAEASALFARLLREGLASCKAVREVRVFGLLIGIELDASRWPRRWFRKRLFWLYLYSLLRRPRYPVLVGFCQYEPNVLKITPPLTVAPREIEAVCGSIVDVLTRPFHRLLLTALLGLIKPFICWRRKYEYRNAPPAEPAPR